MKYNLVFPFPPGDCWCLTRYVRDFAEQFPEDTLAPVVPRPEIFRFSPYFRTAVAGSKQIVFRFAKPIGRPCYGNFSKKETMVGAIYDGINELTKRKVKVKCAAPEIYFSEDEKNFSLVPLEKPVCIVNAGWKSDIPVKFWGAENFQKVIDALKDRVLFVQVGATRKGTDFHRPLEGVFNLIGRTTIRELAQLVYHADFVLTGISQLHHLSGIECYKPRHCVTVAGAREPENWANCHKRKGVTWSWLSVNEKFKSCCENEENFHDRPGCWEHDCNSGKPPVCMQSIHPETVIEEILRRLPK